MLLTLDFMEAVKTCNSIEDGVALANAKNYFGMDYDDVIKDLIKNGDKDQAAALLDWKKTEEYVKRNGSQITMKQTYQVFNPLTGTHTEFDDEASARAAAVEISNQILALHKVRVMQAIYNENGDSAWTTTQFTNPITLS
jgi:hypothetical protein